MSSTFDTAKILSCMAAESTSRMDSRSVEAVLDRDGGEDEGDRARKALDMKTQLPM